MPDAVGVIPARYESTRFPGKPLADLGGLPLVQHVYQRARRASRLSRLLVATDDERIRRAVEEFGGEAVMTSRDHASGTDRLAEVARGIPAPLFVNIQGDEPLVDPRDIDQMVAALDTNPELSMVTLRRSIDRSEDWLSPHVVKVVSNERGEALYFSRSPIPYCREERPPILYRHLGLYAYRRELLLEIAAVPPGVLERAEQLEQLRVLEMGHRIKLLDAIGDSVAVDTPEDLARVLMLLGPQRL